MKVGADHWFEGVTRKLITGGAEMNTRRALVIHFTSGMSAQSSIDFWRTSEAKGASAHVIIDRDGTILQCRPFNRTCGHAGVSRWKDPNTGKLYSGLNSCTIGIELANAGDSVSLKNGVPVAFGKYPLPAGHIKAKHRNGGPVKLWENYPEAQLETCRLVALALVERYNLDDVTGHDCIAPERKNDPGPAFEIQTLREACGFIGMPVVHWA